MKVSQEPIDITSILKDKTFIVPLYQREYSWNLVQVSDLFYDIKDTNDSDGHFLGSLLLSKNSSSTEMEIIDGQQRITTIFLLLFSILKEIKSTNKQKAINRINSLLFEIDSNDLSEEASLSTPTIKNWKERRKTL